MDSKRLLEKEASLEYPNRAIGYYKGFEANYSNMVFYGAGGQFVSVKDMTTFVQFLLNNGKINDQDIISKNHLEEMAEKQFSTADSDRYYGLGLYVDNETFDGIEIRYNTGGGFGYNAAIAWIMEYDIGVVFLSNYYQH